MPVAPVMGPLGPVLLRVIICGSEGSGKTFDVLCTAVHIAETETPGTFYWLNTEGTAKINRALCRPEFIDLPNRNLRIFDGGEWDGCMAFRDAVKAQAGPQDFVVVDRISRVKELARDEHLQAKYGMPYSEFLRTKKAKLSRDGDVIYGGLEAPDHMHIGAMWKEFMFPAVINFSGHALLIADVSPLYWERKKEHPDKTILGIFEEFNARPGGDSGLVYWITDVVVKSVYSTDPPDYRMKEARFDNRIRTFAEWTKVENFARQYLHEAAGWRYV